MNSFRPDCRAVQNALSELRSCVDELESTARTSTQALLDERRFLDLIVDNIPIKVFVKDAEQLRYVLFNRAGEDLIGYKREQLIGRCDHDFFPKEEADFFVQKDREALRTGRMIDVPAETIQTRTGRRVLHTRKIPIFDASDRPAFLLGISEDVTDQLRREQDLIEAIERAEESSRLKTSILSNMSHEIRTPLTSILGFSEIMMQETEHPVRELAGHVRSAGERLLRTLDSVLTLASIDCGHTSFELEAVDLAVLVRDVITSQRTCADENGIELQLEIKAHLDRVHANPAATRQIVSSVISNALKFSFGGVVRVTLTREDNRIVVEIQDNGVGMSESFIPRAFEAYEQESTGPDREYAGVGLGLTVVKRLVDRMDGFVALSSRKHIGTKVRIGLPIENDV